MDGTTISSDSSPKLTCSSTSTSSTSTSAKNPNTNGNGNPYKDAYNRHRRRPKDPNYIGDLKDVVDFSSVILGGGGDDNDDRIIPLVNRNNDKNSDDASFEYKYKGPIFGIKSHPGFIYIPQALSTNFQHHLAYKSLTEFCNPPHATNIDLIPMKKNEVKNRMVYSTRSSPKDGDSLQRQEQNQEEETMWDLWKREHGHSPCMKEGEDKGKGKDMNTKKEEKASSNKISHQAKRAKHELPNRRIAKANSISAKTKYYKSFEKLSWATSGYQYDWTARAYTEQHKSHMPDMLERLGSIFAQLDESIHSHAKNQDDTFDIATSICNDENTSTDTVPPFTASASIINYYSLKSNMGGHRDDLELDFTRPVVSVSVGLPAIFLLGGKTKTCPHQPVIPILIRPGDVYLLAGESRLCYHGMARVIPNDVTLPPVGRCIGGLEVDRFQIRQWKDIAKQKNVEKGSINEQNNLTFPVEEEGAIKTFLSTHRINVNVRQVLPPGMLSIPYASPDTSKG